jgi:hypothetical protein
MSTVTHHRDGSRTVQFSDGHKVTFGKAKRKAVSKITGTPYIFSAGAKIELPSGVAHGMIFEYRGRHYVAMRYKGTNRLGRPTSAAYGQPVTLTRS